MRSRAPAATPILLALLAIQAGILLLVFGVYKLHAPSWATLASRVGVVVATGLLLTLGGIVVAARARRQARRSGSRVFALCVAASMLSLVTALALGELALRGLAARDLTGVRLGRLTLAATWEEVRARNRALLERATPSGTWREPYLVFDPDLGWSVGRDRASADGLYFSSSEGIRSAAPGVRFADHLPRLRVAIVGDSNAFALEVAFAQSWGAQLERLLGSGAQVLNFGVDGYGIDQALLRYRRDVRAWDPDIVIWSFIQHDLLRAMAVYTFVSFPAWQFPFAKPRLVSDEDALVPVNTPLEEPWHWLGYTSIDALPHIELDYGYRGQDWRVRGGPLLLRLITTLFPRWPPPAARIAESEVIRLNARMFAEFNAAATAAGSTPLLVYLPTRGAGDFTPGAPRNLARRTLARAGVGFLDLGACIHALRPDERWAPSGSHFSARANRAIAECLAPAVRQHAARTGGDDAP